jgi:hypothetical protein
MTLKSQDDRQYRGLIWIGRLYRLAGWMGLVATIFFTGWGFVSQWQNMALYWSDVDFWTQLTHSMLMGFFFLVVGLALSAVAFGISLGVQVGLTIMKNSQTQVELLRRLAQNQAELDTTLRLQDPSSESDVIANAASDSSHQRHHSYR